MLCLLCVSFLFLFFSRKTYWNEEVEEEFLKRHNWSYNDEHLFNRKSHQGKGCGAKIKSSIAQLIATVKANILKKFNDKGKEATMSEMKQLDDRQVYFPINIEDLTAKERMKAME